MTTDQELVSVAVGTTGVNLRAPKATSSDFEKEP